MKKVLGIIERAKVIGTNEMEVLALVDTGARLTSVDTSVAEGTGIGPLVRSARVRTASANVITRRPVLKATIEIGGEKFTTEVNVADRSRMAFPVLIGRNILRGRFLVDSEKNADILEKVAKEKKMRPEFS